MGDEERRVSAGREEAETRWEIKIVTDTLAMSSKQLVKIKVAGILRDGDVWTGGRVQRDWRSRGKARRRL